MFNFGPVEIMIIAVLGYLAFKPFLLRRYPNFRRAFNFVFFTTALFILLFQFLAGHR